MYSRGNGNFVVHFLFKEKDFQLKRPGRAVIELVNLCEVAILIIQNK